MSTLSEETHVTAMVAPGADLLRVLYEPIREELAAAEAILQRELSSQYPYVDALVKHGFLLGGKRLRPALLLLCAKAFGPVTREHLTLAAVVEMIHTATLVHDDVLDDALVRRHRPTVNAHWDDEAAVLLGDFLFTHAFYLASTLETTHACRTIGRATNIVCEGELRQKGSRGDYSLDEKSYLQIIEAKTAELCACACELGAHYASGGAAYQRRLAQYGRDLGIAFQIADDLLDVIGQESAAGKTLGADLDKQKPTLPLIRALDLADDRQRAEMLALAESGSPQRRRELLSWLERFEAIDYARARAQQFAERARQIAQSLPPSPAKGTLCLLSEFVVDRSV